MCGRRSPLSNTIPSGAWQPAHRPRPPSPGRDLLPVGVGYLFRDPMIHLVAISDPTLTPDGLFLQLKVLWEAAEVHPWQTGGSPPPELPWEGPSGQSQALLLAVGWHKYDRTPVWSAVLTMPPPGVHGSISSFDSAINVWSSHQYVYSHEYISGQRPPSPPRGTRFQEGPMELGDNPGRRGRGVLMSFLLCGGLPYH